MSTEPSPPRVSLALGSGGARGYAHIGAIQVLQERGFEIAVVAGSSMGALVGGLHAAGRLEEYTEWALTLNQLDVLRLLDVSLASAGAIRAERMFSRIRDLLGDVLIEDLPVPFTAVATDLVGRREVWFQRGPLDIAIRASIALPGIFTPVMLNGRVLVDGGLMDPVPVAPTAAVPTDVTVAVSLGGERRRGGPDGQTTPETAEPRPVDEWLERFRRGASQVLEKDLAQSLMARFGAREGAEVPEVPEAEALPAGLGRFDVMNQSLEAMQSVLTGYRLAGFPPDVLVTVPKDACRTLDFHRAESMIALGRELTTRALDQADLGA
jgi:NTE family protein